MPLGLFADANYESGEACIESGDTLLFFTDGLTDSISASVPERLLRDAVTESLANTMSNLKSLVEPQFNEDDVTVLLVKRRE